ncbi:hypothetical protein AVEN_19865-1 [Araneus ventricosus]|uniref:Uncharacterized protein n=1 Tax=Araneus ventricosus TaxID=182803 RepID=A0A4Y2P9M6_ARAVE|nr:hypothetical protein AVEN_87051-1 [Araneus ventricosus]GBN48678.1 hypothetical protein AVEN_19865-1 [Araneus ventricosus]
MPASEWHSPDGNGTTCHPAPPRVLSHASFPEGSPHVRFGTSACPINNGRYCDADEHLLPKKQPPLKFQVSGPCGFGDSWDRKWTR